MLVGGLRVGWGDELKRLWAKGPLWNTTKRSAVLVPLEVSRYALAAEKYRAGGSRSSDETGQPGGDAHGQH